MFFITMFLLFNYPEVLKVEYTLHKSPTVFDIRFTKQVNSNSINVIILHVKVIMNL